MTELRLEQGSPLGFEPWGERMLAPDEVAHMARFHQLGWGTRRIAGELGCSRNTVKRYLAAGSWVAIRPARRRRRLDGLEDWLRERFRQHRGNCDVVRQDLLRERGVRVSLRTVERAAVPLRQALQAEARACLRFETAPGRQLQIDFGRPRRRLAASGCRCICSWPPWATRDVCLSAPFGMSGNQRGLTVWRARSSTLAGCRGRCYSTMRGRWWITTTRLVARSGSTIACTRLPATGTFIGGLAHPIGPAPRARTSAASAMSSATPLPVMTLSAGPHWRGISTGGCARSPTNECTAPPARCR